MVDLPRLRRLLDRIAEEEAHLERLASFSDDELLDDHDRMHAVKYGFVVAIEAAIDAGRHIIASEGLRPPDSFSAVFDVLVDAGYLSAGTAAAMARAARFRNLLVHQYADVDDRRVIAFLRTHRSDLERFRREIAERIAP